MLFWQCKVSAIVELAKIRLFLMIDVPGSFPYLTGLLNRMTIQAIAASPFIRDVNKNHEAWERRMSPLCN
jgi:hypothetical protein